MRIGVVAPSSRFSEEAADMAQAIAARAFPQVELLFHPQCFATHNHFAGADALRLQALLEFGNDPAFDAIWFARGGYGACRIAEEAVAGLNQSARDKDWLGYSDAGYLLAGLYKAGFPHVAHGPVVQDVRREGGEAALRRGLAWLVDRDASSLEPGLDPNRPQAAFNLTVLSLLLGTSLEPDLSGHVLLLEEVSEPMYRIDRAMFHLIANPLARGLSGIRLGRCSDLIANDPDFGDTAEQVVRYWCDRAGIEWLGAADIGHDADNKIVPFGPDLR